MIIGPLDVGDNGLDVGLVETEDCGAIKRNAVDELEERALNVFERSVLIEMFTIDGGYDCHYGREHEEAAIAFVGFHDEIFALADARCGSAWLTRPPITNVGSR